MSGSIRRRLINPESRHSAQRYHSQESASDSARNHSQESRHSPLTVEDGGSKPHTLIGPGDEDYSSNISTTETLNSESDESSASEPTHRQRESDNRQASLNLIKAKEQKRDAEIKTFCVECGAEGGKKPLKILLVGKPGVGKSSFINGVAAALSGQRWREYAYAAEQARAEPLTEEIKEFPKCCHKETQRYKEVNLPTLIDVPGLSDEEDEILTEVLRLLFHGRIKDLAPLKNVYDKCCQLGNINNIRREYSQVYPDMRVDRVIFVADATQPLPTRLMVCVVKAARSRPSEKVEHGRVVPLFGVLTKMDKVDTKSSSFLDTKKTFKQTLALNGPRLLLCKNYCDDTDPGNQRVKRLDPDLDIPYIEFMTQICDFALTVGHDDENLPEPEKTWLETLYNLFAQLFGFKRN